MTDTTMKTVHAGQGSLGRDRRVSRLRVAQRRLSRAVAALRGQPVRRPRLGVGVDTANGVVTLAHLRNLVDRAEQAGISDESELKVGDQRGMQRAPVRWVHLNDYSPRKRTEKTE